MGVSHQSATAAANGEMYEVASVLNVQVSYNGQGLCNPMAGVLRL